MIRKAIIVVLTLAAVCVGMACAISYPKRILFSAIDTEHLFLLIDLSAGRVDSMVFEPNDPHHPRHPISPICHMTFRHVTSRLKEAYVMDKGFIHMGGWYDYRPTGPYYFSRVAPSFGCYPVAIFFGAPLWPLFISIAAYPTIAFIRGPLRRWRLRRKGLCLNCGYDLKGNVSGICPECGSPTAPDK